jgi:hypothetical protein
VEFIILALGLLLLLGITPTNVLLDRMAALLAADATTLAPAALNVHVHLAMAPFTPGPTLTVASFTEAAFTGYAALNAGTGGQQSFADPGTGNRVIQLLEPAGGWHWATTAGAGLPITIYGYYVTDNANAVLYGSALLPTPVTLAATAQGVDVAQVRFALIPSALQ